MEFNVCAQDDAIAAFPFKVGQESSDGELHRDHVPHRLDHDGSVLSRLWSSASSSSSCSYGASTYGAEAADVLARSLYSSFATSYRASRCVGWVEASSLQFFYYFFSLLVNDLTNAIRNALENLEADGM